MHANFSLPLSTNCMQTHSKSSIFKFKALFSAKYPIQVALASYLVPTKPSCYSQAVKSAEWQAVALEFEALHKQGTWSLVPRRPDQNVFGCRWVYKVKQWDDGSIKCFKPQLVAKGFHQQLGIDCTNTFSLVVKPTIYYCSSIWVAFSSTWCPKYLLPWDASSGSIYGTITRVCGPYSPISYLSSS